MNQRGTAFQSRPVLIFTIIDRSLEVKYHPVMSDDDGGGKPREFATSCNEGESAAKKFALALKAIVSVPKRKPAEPDHKQPNRRPAN